MSRRSEWLISTRDPKGVLEMIADSLKAIVPYDALTIYRCDFEAGVRRAVVARDRFAEVDRAQCAPELDRGEALAEVARDAVREHVVDQARVVVPGEDRDALDVGVGDGPGEGGVVERGAEGLDQRDVEAAEGCWGQVVVDAAASLGA